MGATQPMETRSKSKAKMSKLSSMLLNGSPHLREGAAAGHEKKAKEKKKRIKRECEKGNKRENKRVYQNKNIKDKENRKSITKNIRISENKMEQSIALDFRLDHISMAGFNWRTAGLKIVSGKICIVNYTSFLLMTYVCEIARDHSSLLKAPFNFFNMFPTCSQHVPTMFPTCSTLESAS